LLNDVYELVSEQIVLDRAREAHARAGTERRSTELVDLLLVVNFDVRERSGTEALCQCILQTRRNSGLRDDLRNRCILSGLTVHATDVTADALFGGRSHAFGFREGGNTQKNGADDDDFGDGHDCEVLIYRV